MATKIMFLATTVYQTIPPVTYNAGDIVDLRDDIAMRWVSRGLATADLEAIAKADAPYQGPADLPPGPVGEKGPSGFAESIPDDWRTFNAADTVALAVKLGADPEVVRFKAQAIDFIDAKIAELRNAQA